MAIPWERQHRAGPTWTGSLAEGAAGVVMRSPRFSLGPLLAHDGIVGEAARDSGEGQRGPPGLQF